MILSFEGVNDFLSNFEQGPDCSPIQTNRYITSPADTVEHFFQAAKGITSRDALYVLEAATPGQAKRRGREIQLRHAWDSLKFDVMLTGLRAKFDYKHPLNQQALLATGLQLLVEGNEHGDRLWGAVWAHRNNLDALLATGYRTWAVDGSAYLVGHNWLGRLLELVREEVRTA